MGPLLLFGNFGVLFDWWEQTGPASLLVIPEIIWEGFLGIYCAVWGFKKDSPILRPNLARRCSHLMLSHRRGQRLLPLSGVAFAVLFRRRVVRERRRRTRRRGGRPGADGVIPGVLALVIWSIATSISAYRAVAQMGPAGLEPGTNRL